MAVHIQKWATELKLKLYILSNGSVYFVSKVGLFRSCLPSFYHFNLFRWAEATKKFMQKTSHGDLSALIAEQFDTTLGQLTSPETFKKLIAKTKDDPANTVFLTKSADEAKAAKAAGLQVVLVLTHSDKVDAVADKVKDIPIARSFTQIEFV